MGNPSKPVPPFSGYGAQLNGSITTDSNNSKTTSDNSEHPGSSADVNFNSAESVAISNDVVIHMEEEEDVQEGILSPIRSIQHWFRLGEWGLSWGY